MTASTLVVRLAALAALAFPAAAAFLAFLKSPQARTIIAEYGYTPPDRAPAT